MSELPVNLSFQGKLALGSQETFDFKSHLLSGVRTLDPESPRFGNRFRGGPFSQ